VCACEGERGGVWERKMLLTPLSVFDKKEAGPHAVSLPVPPVDWMTCVCVYVCGCVFEKKNAHTPPLPPVTRNISDISEDGFIYESILHSPLVRIKSTYHRCQLEQTHPMQNAHLFSHERQAPRLINTYIRDRDMLRCKKLHRVVCDRVCT
jgi:hypothetical protein